MSKKLKREDTVREGGILFLFDSGGREGGDGG